MMRVDVKATANRGPIAYNYLFPTARGTYRLCQVGDPVSAPRHGLPLWPDETDVDPNYRSLWQKWRAWQSAIPAEQMAPAVLAAPEEAHPSAPKNSDRYLAAFNRIEAHLRKLLGKAEGFSRLVTEAALSRNEVRPFREELLEFADLRNAIVHKRKQTDFVIAEPHPEVVRRIEYICEAISNPVKVIPLFQRKVEVLQANDSLTKPLDLMRTRDISQFPVFEEGQLLGLLSERCIARWLAHCTNVDLVILSETPVKAVLRYEESGGHNFALISRSENVFGACERFTAGPQRQLPQMDALLITHSGKPGEALLGIITAWDMLNLPDPYEP
ncbi:MAG TPA: CBS domain-containing protein [Symbiobacteriaceae bacterium]|nr:CBS domain-containing protein [Symbiobacteriaceae bacterium]